MNGGKDGGLRLKQKTTTVDLLAKWSRHIDAHLERSVSEVLRSGTPASPNLLGQRATSSAKRGAKQREHEEGKSLIKMINRRAASTEPCGTLAVTSYQSDDTPLCTIENFLPRRKSAIQRQERPFTPARKSLKSRPSCHTESNAFLMSRKATG